MKRLTPTKTKKQSPDKSRGLSPRQEKRSSPRKTEYQSNPVFDAPKTRGRSYNQEHALVGNERRIIKNIFEKQVITLTYIQKLKSNAKKVETACILLVD